MLSVAPALSACAGDWHVRVPEGHAQLPFFEGLPTIKSVRTLPAGYLTGRIEETRIQQASGERRSFAWSVLGETGARLLDKAATLGLAQLHRDPRGFNLPSDKRAFLVSVRPDILVLVPHTYPPVPASALPAPGNTRPTAQPTWWLYVGLGKDHKRQYGEYMHPGISGYPDGQERTTLEVSSAFPDVPGTLAVSNQWEGARTLEQMEADRSLPFKTSPTGGLPGFRRLVPR